MWCYEHFEMEHGPDIVTFAKKMFSGGIYHNRKHRPKQAGRIMNTWVGDPHKVLMLKEVIYRKRPGIMVPTLPSFVLLYLDRK